MSNLSDHALSGLRCRFGVQEAHIYMDLSDGHADLRGTPPWRSIPLWVSNDRAEAYFEIYQAVPSPGVSATVEGEQWQWRLCEPGGHVRASGGPYDKAEECVDAVKALRQSAGTARIRHLQTE
ncbi:hypothetical protein [Novosphingobium sediminicola]|uniref:DUF1508 domain-containing protein n=1 Tax=Novosphingobium sediminicola TaxID=563162 RepID=A0A7W6CN53_9SPHN|nr:hypothetical protein [Novosphingobium sediminicola]MBB3954547.1 hypothetical protein [Novosphingobium sediminicola]